jgi:sporulation protein YlmC with PRC-barrel domain
MEAGMLQKAMKDLKGDALRARDGDVGSVRDVYFDDERWAVRYLVVDTGAWLPGKKVLISPASLSRDRDAEAIAVNLTREQVKAAPDIDTDAPISRRLEEAHARYYGYPYYWGGPGLWGVAPTPLAAPPAEKAQQQPPAGYREALERDKASAERSHLRSGAEVVGYAIRAADGEIGHVEDLLVDDETWAIADMVVDTRNWLPGKKVLVPPSEVAAIDWEAREVRLRLTREALQKAPEAP